MEKMDSVTQEDFREDQAVRQIIGAAIDVHKAFGPGLLESLYEACLHKALVNKGLKIRRQIPVPVQFEGEDMGTGFRLDLLVEERVIVEIKCVEKILPIHEAQLMTYMKLAGKRLGLIINFNETLLKNGIKRTVLRNKKPGDLSELGGEKDSGK